MKRSTLISGIILVLLIAGGVSYLTWHGEKAAEQSAADEAKAQQEKDKKDMEEVRTLITDFGHVLKNVPLSGTKEIAAKAMDENYARFVSSDILSAWKNDPIKAPGRMTSSPWPERIDIIFLERDPEDESYIAQGNVVEVTSVEMENGGGNASTYPIAMKMRKQNDRWVITGFVKGSI